MGIIINHILITTMQVYQEIQQSLKKHQPLTDTIGQLYSTLLPKRKFQSQGLNQQQCLSLVYEHLRAPLSKLTTKIENQIKSEDQAQDYDQDQVNGEDKHIEQDEQHSAEVQQEQDYDDLDKEQKQDEHQLEDDQQQQDNNMHDQQQVNDNQKQEGQEQPENVPSQQISQQDVGLYGEQLDEEDMESYENQQMEDDPQFGNFNVNKMDQKFKAKDNAGEDDYIQDNFDQFRQIQLQNTKNKTEQVVSTQLDKQIDRLQEKVLKNKNWVLGGQIKARERPTNSLLDTELQYKSGVKFTHQITQNYNSSLQSIIKQRILDEIFDDRVRIIPNTSSIKKRMENVSTQKSIKGLAELYEIQFRNSLGLGDNKNQKLKKQIMNSLKQVNYYLDSLSNTGFALKPTASIQKNGVQAIVAEDKVPVTNWNGEIDGPKLINKFQADKQINKKTLRLRNKRNARQRKKQQDKKRMNKSIQYGGMTKIEAEARKKIAKTKMNNTTKYSKSADFFSKMNNRNTTKPGKPNPSISKLKI